jgi:putative Holliday junction resolvase
VILAVDPARDPFRISPKHFPKPTADQKPVGEVVELAPNPADEREAQEARRTAVLRGVDYGQKYIGMAVGSTQSGLAQPLATVSVSADKTPDWGEIARLIEAWKPHALVVGVPLNMDGTKQPMTRAARAFGERLRERYNLPIHMVDERLTTRVAKDQLYAAGIAGTRHKRHLDKAAAQAILQAFLDEQTDDDAPAG